MPTPAIPEPARDRAPMDEAARWAALRARDPQADGAFVYGVRTTGVYCRPSCPSRPARPENVSFHLSCEAAEAAGFRPCRRCRPDAAGQGERDAAAVARACRLIDAAETAPDLDALAAEAGLSRFHFHRVFRRVTGVTPRAYAAARLAGRVADGLREAPSVTAALYEAGYNSPSRFYAAASARLGMSPAAYRDGGARTAIRFAVGPCSLGSVLVAATERGSARSCSATIPTRCCAISRTGSRRRICGGAMRPSRPSSRVWWRWLSIPAASSTCRSISAAPRSSSGSGRH